MLCENNSWVHMIYPFLFLFSKKFGMIIGKTWNNFILELGELNNCRKLIPNLGYG